MRRVMMMMIGAAFCFTAAPSFAQSDRAYLKLGGGVAVGPDVTSGDVVGEAGVRVAPRLFVFGEAGQFHNLQPSLVQPAVDVTDTLLSAAGVSVAGSARVPAFYSMGGARYEVPTRGLTPYVLAGAGFARLTPSAQFIYSSGALGDSTPTVGSDVTSQLVTLGDFTQPAASNAFAFTAGAGVEVPVAPRVNVDVGYRLSRIQADTPLTAHSVVAGIGYRF